MKNNLIRKVHIIGDVHYDEFVLSGISNVSSAPKLGGVFFVERVLRNKPLFIDRIKIISNYIKVIGVNPAKNGNKYICLGPIFSYVWECDYFKDTSDNNSSDEWILRCKEQIDVKKKLCPDNKVAVLDTDSLSKFQAEDNIDYFVFECCGRIADESNDYKGVFYDKSISNKIIGEISAALTLPTDKALVPKFFWILHNEIPPFFTDNVRFDKYIEDQKNKALVMRTVIFLNSSVLRKMGIYIQSHVSWESIANDYICALYSNPLMSVFRQYRHIIVRFGISGAVYSYRIGKNGRWLHRLIFDPVAEKTGLVRDAATQGDVVGYQSVFATCVLNQIMLYVDGFQNFDEADASELADNICDGIRKALASIQQFFWNGLGKLGSDSEGRKPNEIEPIERYWRDFSENFTSVFRRCEESYSVWGKFGHELIPVANPGWTIMVQSAEYKLFQRALILVFEGVDKAFNNVSNRSESDDEPYVPWAPVINFGKNNDLIVIDRREIENYRMIHGLINRHINAISRKPLSIVVFGPPGSGKSFTVTKIIESANSNQWQTEMSTINLTRIKDKQELETYIYKACKSYFEDKIPVIFFDEFDTKYEEEIGWLKVFLSPMEDWKAKDLINKTSDFVQQDLQEAISMYTEKNEKLDSQKTEMIKKGTQQEHSAEEGFDELGRRVELINGLIRDNEKRIANCKERLEKHGRIVDQIHQKYDLKNPIFVFAGGTSHNYRDFIHADDSLSEEQKLKFSMAKGPDFVSRLRGHIDILGPNRVDDYDDGYVIRRAILLRGMLLDRFELNKDQSLNEYIDISVVKAMLKVSTFNHGARSMRAIINMSDTIGGNKPKLVSATLPTLPQLNMHVNGKEFIEMIKAESEELV